MRLVRIYNGSELNVDNISRLEPMAHVPATTICPLYADEVLMKIENERPLGWMPVRGAGTSYSYKPIVAYNVVMTDGHEEVITLQDYLNIKSVTNGSAGAETEVVEDKARAGRLPRINKNIFKRPDCPSWATWAAVDSEANAYWFSEEPVVDADNKHWFVPSTAKQLQITKFWNKDWRSCKAHKSDSRKS